MEAQPASQPRVTFTPREDGTLHEEVKVGDRTVSSLEIIPMTLRVGAATVRMDGIGGVGTTEDCRNRGYARLLMEAAVRRMIEGDAALSMLYGIRDLYPKFGYATAGPDHWLQLERLDLPAPEPPGWTVRPFQPDDFPALQRIYEMNTRRSVGALVRTAESGSWRRLLKDAQDGRLDSCRVVEDREGRVRGYAWLGHAFWFAKVYKERNPTEALIAEAMAEDASSAEAVLAACRRWAVESASADGRLPERVTIGSTCEGPLARAAMHQDARHLTVYHRCGDSMARLLSAPRLLEALRPELELRARSAGVEGSVRLVTEVGSADLWVSGRGVEVREVASEAASRPFDAGSPTVALPQEALARMALGAFPPEDLLDRLPEPVTGGARELLEALFPLRHPHMYLPDRF